MGKSSPKQPNPYAVAQAQTDSNVATAREQARLGMTGQTSDFGSVTYVKDKNSPSGYRAVSTLAPEEQALLAQRRDTQAGLGSRIQNTVSNPFDLNAARGTEISDIQRTFLDPQFQQRESAMKNDLLNRGIREGSEQYDTQMRQFSQGRDDAYNKMFLDAWGLANNAALTERNLPISDYAALNGLTTPTPAPINTPSPGVSPTPVGQYVYDSNRIEQQNAQAQKQGLYGLVGTIGSAFMMSDRRYKTDIRPVDQLRNGLVVYSFRYKGENADQIGLMADEVRQVHPEAVVSIGGIDHVDYERAVA